MPVTNVQLSRGLGIEIGDQFAIKRPVYAIPSGETVTRAWLMIKASELTSDANAEIKKEITTSDVAGTGQVEKDGSDGTALLRFDVVAADWTPVNADQEYFYAIQVLLSGGNITTLERGKESFSANLIVDNS